MGRAMRKYLVLDVATAMVLDLLDGVWLGLWPGSSSVHASSI
jgi:hypothetical protein